MPARLTHIARSTLVAYQVLLHRLVTLLRRAWRTHQRLLRTNPAYQAATFAGLRAAVSQENLLDLAAAVGATLLAIYAATRRGLARI